jgi:hypothetical protein
MTHVVVALELLLEGSNALGRLQGILLKASHVGWDLLVAACRRGQIEAKWQFKTLPIALGRRGMETNAASCLL